MDYMHLESTQNPGNISVRTEKTAPLDFWTESQ
jgi:hypothetical protein